MASGVLEGKVSVSVSLLLVFLKLVEILTIVHENAKTLRHQIYIVLFESDAHQQTDCQSASEYQQIHYHNYYYYSEREDKEQLKSS